MGHSALVGGRYALTAPIARGGMSIVYSALDRALGRAVAIKLLTGDGTADAPARAEREIALASAAHHPGLVEVFDAGTTTWMGRPTRYLVMDLVDGTSLQARIDARRPEPVLLADVAAQIADALAYLHLRRVLHLDVKPGNILIDDDPALGFTHRARLIDFGIARGIDGEYRRPGASIVASAAYMSPEHVAGLPLTGASDVYALGLVLLHGLTGALAFPGSRGDSAVARLRRDPEIPDALPAGWSSLLAAMTIRDAAARPTAHDVAVEFGELRRVRRRFPAPIRAEAHAAPAPFARLRERMHRAHPATTAALTL